jgi:DNA polymerase V
MPAKEVRNNMSATAKRSILAIDLKSFYASVECVLRNLDPFSTPLVVCDLTRGQGTIILAVSPYLKTLGIPSRLRLFDLPKNIKGMIYARPRMETYIKKSLEVLKVYLNYVAEEDMHVYSVDEAFLDITNYLQAAKTDKVTYAKRIINEVKEKTGLTVTAGIGTNLFTAKACMDIEAKKAKDFIASWEDTDIPRRLWPVTPLTKMWGIGDAMEKKLNALGMYAVGDIACADRDYLHEKFGVIGDEIYEHANGRDDARIQQVYIPESTSLCVGQTLFRDYSVDQAQIVISESLDELIGRLAHTHQLAGGLSLWIGYSGQGGFAKALKLVQPVADRPTLLAAVKKLFLNGYDGESKIRGIGIGAFNLESDAYQQLSLFTDLNEEKKEEDCQKTIKKLREEYGFTSLMRASSLLEESNAVRRANQIGGHRR